MAYDKTLDVTRSTAVGFDSHGRTGRTGSDAVASDTADLSPYARSIVLLTAGTVKILPAGQEDDAKPIAWTESLPVGWVCPYGVRRVFSTGTSATFATID